MICTKCGTTILEGNTEHTCEPIDIGTLQDDLLNMFIDNANVLPYYSVFKDLSASGNWDAMKTIINTLLIAEKITQTDIDNLKIVLANQGITLESGV